MKKDKATIFIVEDDKFYNSVISNYIKLKGFAVYSFFSGEEMIEFSGVTPDIILLDYMLPGINGVETMKKIKPIYPKAEYILISGQTEIKIALDSIHDGAYDYIIKDNHAKETALNKIDQILKYRKLIHEKESYKKSIVVVGIVLLASWLLLVLIYFILKR
jgi:DNA-binding NtrC family response regulator